MKRTKVLMGVFTAVALLVGCSTGNDDQSTSSDTGNETQSVLELMSASELTSLDTTAMLDFPDTIMQTAAFEGLYALDESDEKIYHFQHLSFLGLCLGTRNQLVEPFGSRSSAKGKSRQTLFHRFLYRLVRLVQKNGSIYV